MRSQEHNDSLTPAERVLAESLIDDAGVGKPLSDRALQRQRSVEAYLRGEMLPRYITRLAQIERWTREHERRLAGEHADLRAEHQSDPAAFKAAWTARLECWSFAEVNVLITQHNDWYPIERDLPMDIRTRDYVLVNGHDYRRTPLSADWALQRFPAE